MDILGHKRFGIRALPNGYIIGNKFFGVSNITLVTKSLFLRSVRKQSCSSFQKDDMKLRLIY